MASVITIAGEQLFAAKAQANEQLDIDTFIFANVPNQDPNAPINREEGIPTAHIVYQQNVQQVGRINDNVVVYSTVLDSITGPFEFNWVGLYSSVNQKLVAINHVPTVTKTATAPGAAGNTLNRNFGIEYSGIAELTGITVDAGTWQIDYTARLSGMDLLTQQLATDMNGKDWFIEDGLKVVPRATANTFSVTPGVGYVSGLRAELKQEHILIVQSYPQFVYVDAWFSGNANSTWSPQLAFTVTNTEMDDYIDPSGTQHYVYKLAVINATDDVEDLRVSGGIKKYVDSSIKRVELTSNYIFIAESISDLKKAKTPSGIVEQNIGQIWSVGDTFFEIIEGDNGDVELDIDNLYANYITDPFLNDSTSQQLLIDLVSGKVASKSTQIPSKIQLSTTQNINESLNPTFPVCFDGSGTSLVTLSSIEEYSAFDIGVDQVTPDLFRRDYYKFKGMTFTGGNNAQYGITFRPFTGSQCLIEDVTFMGYGNSDSWCLNFQAQNWWPIIDKFSLSDQGEHINGIKAIDDDERVISQGTGNSRLIIDKARIRYLNGRLADTTGIKLAATAAIIHLSAIENAGKGVQFHYPSNASKLQNAYFEQADIPVGSTSIVIGDDSQVPNNYIFNLYIKDVYANLHDGNGNFVTMGNESVHFRDLILDGVHLAKTGGLPIVTPNDIPAQSVYVGYVSSGSQSAILPKNPRSNPVHVVDIYNREWNIINGNGQIAKVSGDSKRLPQNAPSVLADFWSYIGDISGTYFRKVYSGAERLLLRGATTGVRIDSPGSGSYSTISFTIPNVTEHAGIDNTIQLFARAEGGTTKTFRVLVRNPSGTETVLATSTNDVLQDWTEITIPFFFGNYMDLTDDSVIIVEIFGGSLSTQLEFTGVRVYEGNTGLCTNNSKCASKQHFNSNPWFYKSKVNIPALSTSFVVGFDVPIRKLGNINETVLLIIDGGDVIVGNLSEDRLYASFDVTIGNSIARTATVLVYHGGS